MNGPPPPLWLGMQRGDPPPANIKPVSEIKERLSTALGHPYISMEQRDGLRRSLDFLVNARLDDLQYVPAILIQVEALSRNTPPPGFIGNGGRRSRRRRTRRRRTRRTRHRK